MATLTGNQIKNSYDGLIKTNDNGVLGATEKLITDGLGNASTLSLGTGSASFTGDLDLTAATVTGLPPAGIQSVVAGTNVTVDDTDPLNPIVNAGGGDPGLVAGTGANSMKSSSYLTATAASAFGNSIGLGNGAVAGGSFDTGCIAIGGLASATNGASIAIGANAKSPGQGAIAIGTGQSGDGARATAEAAVAVGRDAEATGVKSIAIGSAQASGTKSISIGTGIAAASMVLIGDATGASNADNTIAIGLSYPTDLAFRGQSVSVGNAIYPSEYGVYIGHTARHNTGGALRSIGIGYNAQTTAAEAISIGANTNTTADGAVALGTGITAARANTVSIKELELQTVGGGIFMKSPDGTVYKLTVANGGTLTVTAV